MEPKKHPGKDLNKSSNLYFIMGLVLALLLTFALLEWKTYDGGNNVSLLMNTPDDMIDEAAPIFELKATPPPKLFLAPPVIEIREDDDDVIETPIESTEPDEGLVYEVTDIKVATFDEPDEIDFIAIEEVPVFPGCENDPDKRACFQKMIGKHIAKNFKYPEPQREMGIMGKVHVRFVIQKDGSIDQIQLRGPDKGLEAEAARIIGKLPKMTPGKQRGTAVKVPFSIPITFSLQ